MWILTPLESGGVTHYLWPNKEYVVGRKNCDILLPNDQSISRAHAYVSASDQTLTLKDSSKYGTFVNEERLSGDTPRNLKSGDRVTFGVYHSKFRVDHQVLVVCSSCLDVDGKMSLSRALLPMGGKMVNSWTQDCTYLVMPSVKVTIKTICALLCCRPIVKQEYFTEFSNAMQQKLPPPKSEMFYPDIDEPSLKKEDVDLRERLERKCLFTGKTFLFLSSKQLKRLSSAVSFGGGSSQLLEEESLPMSLLESPWSCVVDIATGNSQTLLPATRKWADSVGKILQKRGFRFITESEIGLAAIYVSCDKYCNPANKIGDSETMQVRPAIPSPSLSQNAAVNETVLPAASQNITAYVANTETSQRMDLSGVTAVGETPERNRSRSTPRPGQPKPTSAREQVTTCTVAETMMSSFHATERVESEPRGAGTKFVAPPPQNSESPKTSPQKRFNQKQKPLQQASPHKQSSLTSFFQSVNKKRPREEPTAESESKRTAPPHPDTTLTTTITQITPHTPSNTGSSTSNVRAPSLTTQPSTNVRAPPLTTQPSTNVRAPSLTTQPSTNVRAPSLTTQPSTNVRAPSLTTQPTTGSQLGSEADLFPGQIEALSDRVSRPSQQGLQTMKRKEMEPEEGPKGSSAIEIEMEELESMMSDEMVDYEDEQMSLFKQSSSNEQQPTETVQHIPTNKKQRVQAVELSTPNQRFILNPEEGSPAKRFPRLETAVHSSASKKQQVHPQSHDAANQKSSLDPKKGSTANRNQRSKTTAEVKEEEVSFVVASKPQAGEPHRPEAELGVRPTSSKVKQEVSVSEMEEELPSRLLQVEFKSLLVTAPSRTRSVDHGMNGHSQGKNFKRFRKVPVPGGEGLPNIIGGSDLLAHNRGKSSELEDWLRDAAEEERQSKQDETVGDDLFRYNPRPVRRR